MPEEFFRADVRVGEMQHLEFATDKQLYVCVHYVCFNVYFDVNSVCFDVYFCIL